MTATIEIPEQFDGMQVRRAEIQKVEERLIHLRAVPYDVETELFPGLFESFAPGAFAAQAKDPARVKLYHGHTDVGGHTVGRAMKVEDRSDGVYVSARISETVAGNELYELLQDGTLDEASIEFWPIPKAMEVSHTGDYEGTHIRHKRGRLLGVAIVPHGAYGRDAVVKSVRDLRRQQREKARAEALARLDALNH